MTTVKGAASAAPDPLDTVWAALERAGYSPRGPLHDFRARCPGHDGDNPTALHVRRGGGGQALLWCHAHGCSVEEIIEPLSLRVRDLYPLDPGDSGRRLRTARRDDFTGDMRTLANLLLAAQRLGERWTGALWLGECPNCEHPYLQVVIGSHREAAVTCPRGCNLRTVTQALADRLVERKRAA